MPQGSLLGPRLFGFYVNDLPDSVESGEVEILADDTEAYCVWKTVDEVACILQKLVNEVSKWCRNNSLSLYPDKIEIMIISKTNFTCPLQPISLNGNIIKYVSNLFNILPYRFGCGNVKDDYQIIAFSKELAIILFRCGFCIAHFTHFVHFYGTDSGHCFHS